MGDHGVRVHIFHCKTFHCFFITISGCLDQGTTILAGLLFYFYCFFIFQNRKKNSSLICQTG